jgi:transcription antitermination protein NusB
MKLNVWARLQSRRALVQAVYQWQMSDSEASSIEADFVDSGSLEKADLEFFQELLRGVISQQAELDALIEPLLDRKLSALDQIELALLRLGTLELKNRIDVPYRVVIDQYVDLAKTFGAEEGHKYINGVLDKLAGILRPLETTSERV